MSNVIQNLFSKIIAFILAVIASLTGNYAQAPEIAIKNDVNNTTSLIQVEIQNYTEDSYVTFDTCVLEKKVDEGWVKLDYVQNYEVPNTAFTISSRQSVILAIDVINTFGTTLEPGDYRLTKELVTSKDYSAAIAKIKEYTPDNALYPDDVSKAEAKAEFEKATLSSLAKTAYSVEFSVKSVL